MSVARRAARGSSAAALGLAACVAAGCDGSPAAPSPAINTFLSVQSSPGDPVGQGVRQQVDLSNATFHHEVQFISDNRQRLVVGVGPRAVREGWSWTLFVTMPPGQALQPGTFTATKKRPGAGDPPGFEFALNAQVCPALTARFVIHDIVLGVSGKPGAPLERLHMTFEQQCEGATAALTGELSIVSS